MATLGLIFSGSHCKEELPLASHRTVASVPVGGRYRLIDFTLSNMVNDNISHVGIVTTSNYQSLIDHIGSGKDWDLARNTDGLTFLPPYTNKMSKYNTRLESMKNIIGFIKRSSEEYVLLTDSYFMCNIDFGPAFEMLKEKNADIVCVYRKDKLTDGDYYPAKVFTLNKDKRITKMEFLKEPKIEEKNISLDIWIMKKSLLEQIVQDAMENDLHEFNKDILSKNLDTFKIYGYEFKGWYGEVTSLQSYFDLNMAMLNKDVREELFNNPRRLIYTKVRGSFPTKYKAGSKVINSTLADGCVIEGHVENCVLFRGVHVKKGAYIKNCVIMQDTIVGENAHLEYVIADKDVKISDNKTFIADYNHLLFVKKGEQI